MGRLWHVHIGLDEANAFVAIDCTDSASDGDYTDITVVAAKGAYS